MRLSTLELGLSVCLLSVSVGCDGAVETTEDSTRIEVEVPKVELGEKEVDLNPSTDGDVDIDTPAKGDS